MTTSSRALALALALSLAMPFAPAIGAAPSAADMETARQLYKEGKELRDKGDLAGARDKFKAAHALGQTPVTGLDLGKTHMLLGELVEAREAFLSVARIPVASDETKKSADARVECDKLAADLKARIPAIKIVVTGAQPGQAIKVTVDGEEIPSAALGEKRSVNPGHHVIVAKTAGAPDARAEVDVKEAETRDVTLALQVSMTTTKPPEKPPEGGPAIAPPATSPTPAPSAPPVVESSGSTSPLVYLGFVGAGVALIGGGITGGLAFSKASEVKAQCPNSTCPADKASLLDQTKTYATISTICFAAAGAGVVLGIIGLTKKSSSDSAYVRPYIGVGSLGLTGAF